MGVWRVSCSVHLKSTYYVRKINVVGKSDHGYYWVLFLRKKSEVLEYVIGRFFAERLEKKLSAFLENFL